jgi:hypothetical protein
MPFKIEPFGIYSSDDLSKMLDVSPQTLAEARRSGALLFTRKGRKTLFLGQWVLDWLRNPCSEEEGTDDAP